MFSKWLCRVVGLGTNIRLSVYSSKGGCGLVDMTPTLFAGYLEDFARFLVYELVTVARE